jgi:hypothetical protein
MYIYVESKRRNVMSKKESVAISGDVKQSFEALRDAFYRSIGQSIAVNE